MKFKTWFFCLFLVAVCLPAGQRDLLSKTPTPHSRYLCGTAVRNATFMHDVRGILREHSRVGMWTNEIDGWDRYPISSCDFLPRETAWIALSRNISTVLDSIAPVVCRIQVQHPISQAHSKSNELKLDYSKARIQTVLLLDPVQDAQIPSFDGKGQPMQIGISRTLPLPYNKGIPLNALVWTKLEKGGQAAAISVTSPGAVSLRMA